MIIRYGEDIERPIAFVVDCVSIEKSCRWATTGSTNRAGAVHTKGAYYAVSLSKLCVECLAGCGCRNTTATWTVNRARAQTRAKEEELPHVDRRKLGSNEQGTHRAPANRHAAARPHPVTEALSQSYPNTPIPVGKESGFMFSLLSSVFFLDLIFG